MNKIKLLYDVVMTMKDKEVFKGTIKGEGVKDQVAVFSFNNEFERNNLTGLTRAKVSAEMDCEGKKVKHESTTEFDSRSCHGHMHRGFMAHMHSHRHFQAPGAGHDNIRCGGLKQKLTMIAFLLNILNNIKVDELEDKRQMLSLNLKEIPEELKKAWHERTSQKTMFDDHHGQQCCMKEFHSMDNPGLDLKMLINKNNEVEKIELSITGEQKNEQNIGRMSLNAELCLTW